MWQQLTRIEQVMRDNEKIYLQADFSSVAEPDAPIKATSTGMLDASLVDDSTIDHNQLLNTHNLTTDIDHDQITNTHNLTTDIDHSQLTNLDYASSGHTGFAADGILMITSNRWRHHDRRVGC